MYIKNKYNNMSLQATYIIYDSFLYIFTAINSF